MFGGETHHVELGEPVDVLEGECLGLAVFVCVHDGEVGVRQLFYPVVGSDVQPAVLASCDVGHEQVTGLLGGDVSEGRQYPHLFEFLHCLVVMGVPVGVMEDEAQPVVRPAVIQCDRVPVGEGHLFGIRVADEFLQFAFEVGDEQLRPAPCQGVPLLLGEVVERDGPGEVAVDEFPLLVVDDLPVVERQGLHLRRLHELLQVLRVGHPLAFVRILGLFRLFLVQFADHPHGIVDDRDAVGQVKAFYRVFLVLVGDYPECSLVIHPDGVDDDVPPLFRVGDMVERGHRVVDVQLVGLHVHHHRRQFQFFSRQPLLHFLDVVGHMVEDVGLPAVWQVIVVVVRRRAVRVVAMQGELAAFEFDGLPVGQVHSPDAVVAHHLSERFVGHLHLALADAHLFFEQVVDFVEQVGLVRLGDVVGGEGVPFGVRDPEVVVLDVEGRDLVGVARLLPSSEPHGEVAVRLQRRLVDIRRLHVLQQLHPRLEHMGGLERLLQVRLLDVGSLLRQGDVVLPAVVVEVVDAQLAVLEVDLPVFSNAQSHLRERGDEVHELLVLHECEELLSHLGEGRLHPFAVLPDEQLLGAVLDGLVGHLVEVVAVDVVGDVGLALFGDEVGVVTRLVLRHGGDGHRLAFCEPDGHRLLQGDAVGVQLLQEGLHLHVTVQRRGVLDALEEDVHLLVEIPFRQVVGDELRLLAALGHVVPPELQLSVFQA